MSQLDELRHIIIGDNSEQLDELKQRIEDVERRAEDVAEVLSPAIAKEVDSGGEALARSLQKPVSLGLKRAIRSEPEEYAEILYPVMAPSIRRAIAQAISSMMVTINRTIESATTVQGLSLRYESLKTGIPYAELALRRSLLYRVEHVYLIHRETGMALATIHAEDTETRDSDAVGAMFSAIQSFVQDSFSHDESDRLSEAKVGEHNVWLTNSPHLILACVIRGDAPAVLKRNLNDVMDGVRTKFAIDIVDFDGDTEKFDEAKGLMLPLLQSELKEGDSEKTKEDKKQTLGATILLMLIALGLVYLFSNWAMNKAHVSTVEHFLRGTPGIATTDAYWDDGKLVIEGLKDPDAKIPYETFAAYGIEQETLQFNMTPFRSLEVDMELLRFQNELDLPPSLQLIEVDGVAALRGRAPIRWLNQKNVRLRQLAADKRLSIQELSAQPSSIRRLLSRSFAPTILDEIEMITVVEDERSTVQLNGRLEEKDLLLLRAIFTNSEWVEVTALPR